MDGGPTDEDCVDEDKLDDKDEDAEGTLAERTGALGSLSVVIMDGVAKPKLRARGRRTKANLKPVQVEGVGESPAAAASIVCPLTFALKWASRFPAATTLPVSFIYLSLPGWPGVRPRRGLMPRVPGLRGLRRHEPEEDAIKFMDAAKQSGISQFAGAAIPFNLLFCD